MIERVFQASALNIAIQDGEDAGQSVRHVHAHVIPRRRDDLKEVDEVYRLMEEEEGDLGAGFRERDEVVGGEGRRVEGGKGEGRRGRFPAVDAEGRAPRSEEEMRKEAEWLAEEMERDQREGKW